MLENTQSSKAHSIKLKPKIAIFHNFMDNIGGAEMVALYLAEGLNADLYTTNVDFDKIKKMGFKNIKIFSIGKVPKQAPFRHQIAFWKFRKLNLGKRYDFYIIAGDWAMSGAVNNGPNLWYVHSPLNEIWAFKDYVRNKLLSWWKRPLFDIWVIFNRYLNRNYLKSVNKIVCNSSNTQNRIKRYYNRSAVIINPPVRALNHFPKKSKNYWLAVNRLSVAKRIEIQMKAFSKLPNEKLIIVGSYEKGAKQFEDYKKYIESIKPSNVTLLNWVDSVELAELYNSCKGFITTAKDEDFGMTPIEAMASGKPVIAPNEGGYKETVISGKTGILIEDINSDKLIEAIKEINSNFKKNPKYYEKYCRPHAKKFDISNFIKKIQLELGLL